MMGKSVNRILSLLGIQIKKTNALAVEKVYYNSLVNGFIELFALHKKYEKAIMNKQVSGLVFSKDRAMQLHALLISYFENAVNPAPLTVLYTASRTDFKTAYEDLMREVKPYRVQFIEETNFYTQVYNWVLDTTADRIFFMTDDAIIVDQFDFNDVLQFDPFDAIFSLTKGADLTFCFSHNRAQSLPDFKKVLNTNHPKQYFLEWVWEDMVGSPDWIYPLSVDGTFFSRKEIEVLIKNISFRNPNTMEANLQVFVKAFLPRKGTCYPKAKYVNIPCNLVQKEIKNRTTNGYTVDELNQIWNAGKRIDTGKFCKLDANTAQTVKFEFK